MFKILFAFRLKSSSIGTLFLSTMRIENSSPILKLVHPADKRSGVKMDIFLLFYALGLQTFELVPFQYRIAGWSGDLEMRVSKVELIIARVEKFVIAVSLSGKIHCLFIDYWPDCEVIYYILIIKRRIGSSISKIKTNINNSLWGLFSLADQLLDIEIWVWIIFDSYTNFEEEMSLRAINEITIHLESFRNIELWYQGLYFFTI